jgi:hypothetical protein
MLSGDWTPTNASRRGHRPAASRGQLASPDVRIDVRKRVAMAVSRSPAVGEEWPGVGRSGSYEPRARWWYGAAVAGVGWLWEDRFVPWLGGWRHEGRRAMLLAALVLLVSAIPVSPAHGVYLRPRGRSPRAAGSGRRGVHRSACQPPRNRTAWLHHRHGTRRPSCGPRPRRCPPPMANRPPLWWWVGALGRRGCSPWTATPAPSPTAMAPATRLSSRSAPMATGSGAGP